MRLRFTEVNVGQHSAVPQGTWLKRLYLWACEQLYAEFAWQYDLVSWLVSAGQWRRWQAAAWGEVRGRDVLELGCGTGAMLVQGSIRGLSMVGMDRSPRMLAVAQARLARERLYHQLSVGPLMLGDGRKIPLRDRCVDSVMATFPAGYIFDPATLAEVRRILRVGGRLVIVGLWVELHIGWIGRFVPLFYGRPAEALFTKLAKRVEDQGYRVRWVETRQRFVTVGGMVAERRDG